MQQDEHDFWAKVSICHHGRKCRRCCWEWQGSRSPDGHGQASWHGKGVPAYRLVLVLTHGAGVLGRQFLAMHMCHNPPCCNPAHLTLGSPSDNIRDRHRVNSWYSVIRSIRSPLRRYTDLGIFVRCERAKRFLSIPDFASAIGIPPYDILQMEDGRYRLVDMTAKREQLAQCLHAELEAIPLPVPYVTGFLRKEYDVHAFVDPILVKVLNTKQLMVLQSWQEREAWVAKWWAERALACTRNVTD